MDERKTLSSNVVAILPVGNIGLLKLPKAVIGDVEVHPGQSADCGIVVNRMVDEGTIPYSRIFTNQISGINLIYRETRDLPIDDHMAFDHSRYAAARVHQAAQMLSLTGLYQHIVPVSSDIGLTRYAPWCTYCHCISRMDISYPYYKSGYYPVNIKDVPEDDNADLCLDLACSLMESVASELDLRLRVCLELYDHMMSCDVFGVGWVARASIGVTALETLFVRPDEYKYIWDDMPWDRLKDVCCDYPNSFDSARSTLRKVRNDVVHRGGVSRSGEFGTKPTGQTVCLAQTLLRMSLRELILRPDRLP